MIIFEIFTFISVTIAYTHTGHFKTNSIEAINAPTWLKQNRIERITDRIQQKLEWSIRRIPVQWYTSQESFERVHKFGKGAVAVTKINKDAVTVHIGPKVTDSNFDEVFGHELVHVTIAQKYKDAIPRWLEEGLANHIAAVKKVDYKWLSQQNLPGDFKELAHPFANEFASVHMRYRASQAFAEMLNKKCDLQNLIRLSVQRNLEDYIRRTCEIKDLNQAFKLWIQTKSKD